MVDVAPNHMAYMGCGTCVNYGNLRPFNSVRTCTTGRLLVRSTYPSLQASFYHPHCWIDYNNQTSVEVQVALTSVHGLAAYTL